MCIVLPDVIESVVNSGEGVKVPEDTVLDELKNIAKHLDEESDQLSMAMAIYMLGFNTYNGFREFLKDESSNENDLLKRLYMYAKSLINS